MRAAVLSLALLRGASACGFTVHMLNTARALNSPLASTPLDPAFMQTLRANTGAVYAGSPYPDYLYECGPNHDDGEYTHWSPFQAQAAKYIRARYPAPRNASGDALLAFLAGVTSHYMADISWHGLAETSSGYGFIQTIGAMDFNDTGALISSAHTEADTGGEFIAA
jgi:glycosylphosphatidylinositol phospholipase D